MTLGAAFGLAGAGAAQTPASLHPFSALDAQNDNPDGAYPVAALTTGAGGILYGVTAAGGTSGAGTLFQVRPDGSGFTVLHSFTPNTEGAAPYGTLLVGPGGFLYGTTSGQGPSGGGTVFKVAPDGTGFTVLYAFDAGFGGPAAGLTDGGDGFFYGTTGGGQTGTGIVFKIAPDGTGFATLYSFTGGDTPLGAILVGGGRVLYGTTYSGGDNGAGSVFTLHTDGTGYALLYSFTGGTDGAYPQAGLTAGGDGFLYGTTSDSQIPSSYGTVFKIALDGTGFATLYSFTGGADGDAPYAPVALGPDGLLYGTTFGGGASGAGTIFAISPDGSSFTTVASLSGTGGDGGGSSAGLTLGASGEWYGTAYEGGPNGTGALFALAAPVSIHTHVLWNNPDGSASLWDLSDPNPAATAYSYSPIQGWTCTGISVGSDDKTRALWNRTDGMMAVWTISADGSVTSTPGYGPIQGWTCTGISVGPDDKTRALWNRTDGMMAVWTISADGSVTSTPGYGPFAAWRSVTLSD